MQGNEIIRKVKEIILIRKLEWRPVSNFSKHSNFVTNSERLNGPANF